MATIGKRLGQGESQDVCNLGNERIWDFGNPDPKLRTLRLYYDGYRVSILGIGAAKILLLFSTASFKDLPSRFSVLSLRLKPWPS